MNRGETQTDNRTADTATTIRLSDFQLTAGKKVLLQNANAEFPAGKLTLVLGCSGVGKSLLMKILAGLIDPSHTAIRYKGQIQFLRAHDQSPVDETVAVVFQSFALFDELTPSENIEIAVQHSASKDRSTSTARQKARHLLEELKVPADRATSVLSGGQQQRLAIARALAVESGVVLYDEPTSGLDTNTAAQVAELMRETQTTFGRTSVVVTHDYASLLKIADHVVLLNHHTQALESVSREDWQRLPDLLGDPPTADVSNDRRPAFFKRITKPLTASMVHLGSFIESLLQLPLLILPLWKNVGWGLRITRHYLQLVAGGSACLYIAVSGMIIGFVAQDFIFRYLPYRQYTEPLLIENLLHATGFSLYRFLVPILATILIAARSGAAVSADVGSKVYGNQLAAMKTIGMNPNRAVHTPILYAFLIGTPFLVFLSYFVASLTSSVAFMAMHAPKGIAFWDLHFHKELRLPLTPFYKGTGWLIAKLLTCAVGNALISWKCGTAEKQSAADISVGVTRSILWATLFTLLVHFGFSFFEFKVPQ